MRHFFHLALKNQNEMEQKLLPIFLHFNDFNWFSENTAVIFDEICNIITENFEIIENRAKRNENTNNINNISDNPPTRLQSITGKVALAFYTSPRRQFANYSILSIGSDSSMENSAVEGYSATNGPGSDPSFSNNSRRSCIILPFELTAWIFLLIRRTLMHLYL
jgi:hypothetical protein